MNAPFSPGRPNSGGPLLKFKFVETASFIVTDVNTKRSVTLGVPREAIRCLQPDIFRPKFRVPCATHPNPPGVHPSCKPANRDARSFHGCSYRWPP
jgi:hypothetical protein